MFCPNCGTEIEDGALFCHECGTRIAQKDPEPKEEAAAPGEEIRAEEQPETKPEPQLEPQPEPEPEPQPEPKTEPQPAPQPEKPAYTAPVNPGAASTTFYPGGGIKQPAGPAPLRMLKECASSGSFVAATVAFTVALLASIASVVLLRFFGGDLALDIAAKIDSLFSQVSADINFTDMVSEFLSSADVSAVLNPLRTSMLISQLLSFVPSILTAIGLWLIFAASKGSDPQKMGTGGFVIIKTIWIINLVFICLGYLLLFGACILGLIFMPKLGELISGVANDMSLPVEMPSDFGATTSGVFQILIIVFMVIAAITAIFAILYPAKVLRSVNTALKTAKTGQLYKKASAFVAIVLFLITLNSFSAVFMLFSMVSILKYVALLEILSVVGSMVANVCFGVTIFNFNSKFTQLQMQR